MNSMNATAFYFESSMAQESTEIARGLRRRDPALLNRLIEQYQHRLLRYLVYLTGRRELAEDLFQETWIRVLERGHLRIARLFNPCTGSDLGDPLSRAQRIIEWLVDLHDNLLLGTTGRLLNGLAAILVTLLALTGVVLWWPGIKNWRRSLVINWKTNLSRVNWDLHSAVGIWCVLFVLLWGVSGIYFTFPQTITRVLGDRVMSALVRYHFGRMGWASRPRGVPA